SSLTTTAPPAVQTTPQSTTPQSSTVQATSVTASSSPEAPYRVSVGAYGNIDNAQRQLETFRAAGYPVFLGTQGNLNIVLVGPYDDEAEARSVAQRISQSDMGVADPTVYLLESDAPATPAATTVGAPSASTAATTPAQQPAAGASAAASPPAQSVATQTSTSVS